MSDTTAIPDPYDAFYRWCDNNGFADVGSGPAASMEPRRFDEAVEAYAAAVRARDLATELKEALL